MGDCKSPYDQHLIATITRNLFLSKFERGGVRNNEKQLVESYLDNRMQPTSLNGKYSQPTGINLGVLQGTVMGHLNLIIVCFPI
jgi:hypothetical protein